MKGWIKLHRCLMDKAIWLESTPEQKTILITLLMMANHRQKEWEWKGEKYVAKPGQFVTSLNSIAEKSGKGISIQNVRTALDKFERYGFLTSESTKTGRLITIVNWGLYQGVDNETNKANNKALTKHQQRANKELTPNKNDKNDKNERSTTAVDPVKFFVENFGDHNLTHIQTIESYMDDMQSELVIKAMEIAIENDKRFFNYVKGILNNWLRKGIKSIEQYELASKEREARRERQVVDFPRRTPNAEETRRMLDELLGG